MPDALALCSELQAIHDVISLAGNPPKLAEPQTAPQCAETTKAILRHIATAEQAAGTSKLRPRLQDEALSLLVSIKRHVCEIDDYASSASSRDAGVSPALPADEDLLEQFEDLRDKCCYPLMDITERISAAVGGPPVPSDAMTPEMATRLFCVTRNALSRAVREGQIESYRDVHEPKSARRKFSEAHLAKLYERRA